MEAQFGGARAYIRRKTALARLVGVSRQRLHYHTRQPGFPKPDSAGRYKVAESRLRPVVESILS